MSWSRLPTGELPLANEPILDSGEGNSGRAMQRTKQVAHLCCPPRMAGEGSRRWGRLEAYA
jgi:hypothetical protein